MFLGGLLGIAAEAVLTAGIGSYAKAVGKGIPVVARVIRAGETASSLVSGALGVGKQATLISGRTLARGTGLALDAVTDALGRLSVAKQFVVSSRVVDRLAEPACGIRQIVSGHRIVGQIGSRFASCRRSSTTPPVEAKRSRSVGTPGVGGYRRQVVRQSGSGAQRTGWSGEPASR